MNKRIYKFKNPLVIGAVSLVLVACASGPTQPKGADKVRSKLVQLQSDAKLASLAPIAIKDAEVAVKEAQEPRKDQELGQHLVFMADRKVEIAIARAESRLAEDERKLMGEQRESARLDSRTRQLNMAQRDAGIARGQADELQTQLKELKELNAKETERGLVVTLGDLLFATGKSELKGAAARHLNKLAAFLNKYQDRTVNIEGHTDSVGSEESNLSLSERRAESVRSYLVNQGIGAHRLTVSGKGESVPVSSNNSATGRQQNRRVEVIIMNAPMAVK